MPNVNYPGSNTISLTDFMGEHLSAMMYGCAGDGTTDDAPAINAAIVKLVALGGRYFYLPGGKTYLVNSPIVIPSGVSNMTFFGDGRTTIIKRGANMPSSQGVFDIQGANYVTFKHFLVDGNVTTAARVLYSSFSSNPMDTSLTTNTTF